MSLTKVNINKIEEYINLLNSYIDSHEKKIKSINQAIEYMPWKSSDADKFKEVWNNALNDQEIKQSTEKLQALLNFLKNCKRIYLEKQQYLKNASNKLTQ